MKPVINLLVSLLFTTRQINKTNVLMKHASFFLFILLALSFQNNSFAQGADSLLRFIQNNQDKSSLCLVRNDSIVARLHENKMMPLASTMKIMVAIEFSKQAAFKVFDTSALVSLQELNKYYLPLTDGNAHPNWISYERKNGNIINDSVSLINIARGMIVFSSNANTEYLMDLLGLQNINSNYGLMGVKTFTPLYYPVSSLFLYQNPKKLKEQKVLKQIGSLSENDYSVGCSFIHEQLKNNPTYKSSFRINDLTPQMQKEWTDRLPASTTNAYSHIGFILNGRNIFSPETYQILSQVLESVMQVPSYRQAFLHVGMKGGSTMFVLTKSLYATRKDGEKIALSYFFNNLEPDQSQKIKQWLNDFEMQTLSNPDFAKKIEELSGSINQ